MALGRSTWRVRGPLRPALRRGAVVAAPTGVVIAVGFGAEGEVAAILSLATLVSGFIAFDAPARVRAIWLVCMAPVVGAAGALGVLTSEPGPLAVVAMAVLGAATGYCVAVSMRLYVAALSSLLALLIAQGLYLGADEAPRLLLLGIAGTLIQALVAALAWLGWDRTRGRFELGQGLAGAAAALAANLGRDSIALRHALRYGVALGAGVAVYNLLDLRVHGYWIPLTVLFVLRPDPGDTSERIAMRAAGTIAGLVVGTGLAELAGSDPVAVALVVAVAAAVSYALLALEYAIFTTAITVLVVVLSHASGEPALEAADERAVGTAIGIAIVGLAMLTWRWPVRHRGAPPNGSGGPEAAASG